MGVPGSYKFLVHMMTSSNGKIFCVTGPLCGEFTGPGEFPAQRPVTRSFDVFFDLRLNKRLSKQSWGWWFETPSWSLWRQCNELNNCQNCGLCYFGKTLATSHAFQSYSKFVNNWKKSVLYHFLKLVTEMCHDFFWWNRKKISTFNTRSFSDYLSQLCRK